MVTGECIVEAATELSSAEDFASHFVAKVNGIRVATASAPVPDIEPRATASLSDFPVVTTSEIVALLKKVPPKHCDLDPIPTWLVQKVAIVLAPILC